MKQNDTAPPERALSFMEAARRIVQWRENQDVLAPGERTPYLDKASYAAASLLARELPNSELLVVTCGARAKPGKASIPSRKTREWLVRWNRQLFGIEGQTTEQQAKEHTMKRWFLADGGDALVKNYDVIVRIEAAGMKIPREMETTDPVMARIVSKMEGPLAALVSGPTLDDNTVEAQGRVPVRRF